MAIANGNRQFKQQGHRFPNPAGPPYEPISQPDALFARHFGQILCLGNLGINNLLHLLQALYPATIAQFLHNPLVPLTFLLIRHLEQTTFLVINCSPTFCRFFSFHACQALICFIPRPRTCAKFPHFLLQKTPFFNLILLNSIKKIH